MKRNGETGQALVVAALTLTVLMLAAGLAIDMGYLRYEKRLQQSAADAAAIAGAAEVPYNDHSQLVSAALADAESNGFKDTTLGGVATVLAFSPPITGPNQGNASAVEVTVSQNQPTFFMRIAGINSSKVTARAVAISGSGSACIYALGPGPNSIEVGTLGETIVSSPTCGILDDGPLTVDSAPSHHIYSTTIGAISYTSHPNVTPNPVTPIVPASDPLGFLTPPSAPPACGGGGATPYVPGQFTYPCGLSISTNPGQVVTLNPGTYAIGGSGLTISDNGSDGGTVMGTDVTFYLNGPMAAININDDASMAASDYGTTVQLSAPDSSGSYPGVLIYQDRQDAQAGSVTLYSSSNSSTSSYLLGALYVPDAQLTLDGIGPDMGGAPYDGCSSIPRFTMAVAYTLIFNGNDNFSSNDCAWPPVLVALPLAVPIPNPIKDAVLVE